MSELSILDGDCNANVRLVPLRTGGTVDVKKDDGETEQKVSCPYCGHTGLGLHPFDVTLICGACRAEFSYPRAAEMFAGCGNTV